MSINKALNQVMMYEEIGGRKKKNPEPMDTKPVKMPEAPRPGTRTPTGGNVPPPPPPSPIRMPEPRRPVSRDERRPGTRTPIGGNVPPPPPPSPTDGGAEVTPPQGLPESMKAFWKQRIENQLNTELNEKKKGVLGRIAKGALGLLGVDETGLMPTELDPWGLIPDPFVGPGGNSNPSAYPENSPDFQFPVGGQHHGPDDPDYPDAPPSVRDPATGNEYSPPPPWANPG